MDARSLERRARDVFEAAIELAPAEQAAFLQQAGAADPAVLQLVDELLEADRQAGEAAFSGDFARSVLASFEKATLEARIGERIGPYRLEAFLGAGGMGAVYLGRRQEDFAQEVAIKLLRPGLVDPATISRFERERQLLASLDHPLVARLLDGGVTGEGQPYLVMERIRGLPITLHADRRQLKIEARIELVVAVASAVAHAHRRLIVHRDLKPSNLLIDDEGRPRLLDFGIAKVLEGSPLGREPLTVAGMRPLTPGYSSPEQVTGQSLGTASDQYSLAALTFELLVGVPPLPAEVASWEELEVFCRQRQAPTLTEAWEKLEPARRQALAAVRGLEPAAWRRRLGGDLERILAKALSREADLRYPSIEHFASDLQAWLVGLPVAARRSTWLYRSGKFLRRNPLIVLLIGLSCMLALGILLREHRGARQLAAERDLALLEQRRAEVERTRSRVVARFLVDLFGQADPRQQPGRALTVEELLARGAVAAEAEPRADPETKALLLTAIADGQQSLGIFDPAARLYQRALELRQRALLAEPSGERRQALAAALDALGKSERLRGRFAEAERLSRQALEIRRREPRSADEEIAENLDNLAEALHELGRLDEAEAPYLEALALRRRAFGDGHRLVAESLDHYGLLERNRGRFDAALELYRKALAIRQALLPADSPDLAENLHVIGMLEHDLGRLPEAESSLKAALRVLERSYRPPHADLALCFNDLGMLEVDLQRYLEAEAHLRQALAQRRLLYSGDHPELVQTLGGLGGLLARLGRLQEAGVLFEEALARARRLFGEEHTYVAITRQHLADWLERSGRKQEALAEVERAIAVLALTVGEEHPRYWRARAQRAVLLCRRSSPQSAGELSESTAHLRRLLGPDHPETRALEAVNCPPPEPR